MSESNPPGEVRSIDQLGLAPELKPAAWIQHHKAGDNLEWEDPGGKRTPLYELHALWNVVARAGEIERQKALHDAARWVDEEIGHAVQEGWSIEAVQALMATRDMLKAHADMRATTVEVKA